ncbi:MAG: ATP synthase F0 subunit B [Rickettsiales bacterium]|nr:ATP synthase F0 subunit B [Rickettsiales bacterium]
MIFDEKFWLAIAFIVFVLLLVKLAGKTIINLLNAKSDSIQKSIEDAKKARESAQTLLEDAKKYHDQSKFYAEKLIADANKEAEQLAQKAKKEIDSEISKKTTAAIKRIEIEQEITIKEIKRKIVANALDVLTKNLKSDITNQEHEKLLQKASSDLEKII